MGKSIVQSSETPTVLVLSAWVSYLLAARIDVAFIFRRWGRVVERSLTMSVMTNACVTIPIIAFAHSE